MNDPRMQNTIAGVSKSLWECELMYSTARCESMTDNESWRTFDHIIRVTMLISLRGKRGVTLPTYGIQESTALKQSNRFDDVKSAT